MSETTNATAEEHAVIDELNPWVVLTGYYSDEEQYTWFMHEAIAEDVEYRAGGVDWDWAEIESASLHAFVSRLAKAVLPPVETVYRLAWDHRVIVRPEGLSVDQAWAGLTNEQKFSLDLWRAMMVAALQTARHHVALQEARTQTAVAIMRKPVPVEDTIFERHGSAFERDPVMVAALEGRGWQRDPVTVAALEGRIEGNVVSNDGSGIVLVGPPDFDPDGRAYDDDDDGEAVPPPSPVSDEDLVTSSPEAVPAVEPVPAPKGARRKR